MAEEDRSNAEQSGPQMTGPGKGKRDEGQAMDGGRQSEELRDFPGVYTEKSIDERDPQPRTDDPAEQPPSEPITES
jgi:hypothetical protein